MCVSLPSYAPFLSQMIIINAFNLLKFVNYRPIPTNRVSQLHRNELCHICNKYSMTFGAPRLHQMRHICLKRREIANETTTFGPQRSSKALPSRNFIQRLRNFDWCFSCQSHVCCGEGHIFALAARDCLRLFCCSVK